MKKITDLLSAITARINAHEMGETTEITATSLGSAYTCPRDGYIFIYTGTGTGYLSINNVGAIGGATNNREMVFVRKGTKVFKSGTVSVARFIPLN